MSDFDDFFAKQDKKTKKKTSKKKTGDLDGGFVDGLDALNIVPIVPASTPSPAPADAATTPAPKPDPVPAAAEPVPVELPKIQALHTVTQAESKAAKTWNDVKKKKEEEVDTTTNQNAEDTDGSTRIGAQSPESPTGAASPTSPVADKPKKFVARGKSGATGTVKNASSANLAGHDSKVLSSENLPSLEEAYVLAKAKNAASKADLAAEDTEDNSKSAAAPSGPAKYTPPTRRPAAGAAPSSSASANVYRPPARTSVTAPTAPAPAPAAAKPGVYQPPTRTPTAATTTATSSAGEPSAPAPGKYVPRAQREDGGASQAYRPPTSATPATAATATAPAADAPKRYVPPSKRDGASAGAYVPPSKR